MINILNALYVYYLQRFVSSSASCIQTDSGVDVSNTRLPDPPSSSNQVYALMQKFKTLSSLSEISKSLSRFATKKRSKHSSSSSVSSASLGVESSANLYHEGPSTKAKSGKAHKNNNKVEAQPNSQFYANTDFHALRSPTAATAIINANVYSPPAATSTPQAVKESPMSSPGVAQVNNNTSSVSATTNASFGEYTGQASQEMPVPLARKKSKSGKSFKSKLRRSLVPDTSSLSAFSANPINKSTFYVNGDSPDMDSGIFTGSDKTLKMDESTSTLTGSGKENASFTDLVNEIKTRNSKNTNNNSVEDVRRRSIVTSRPLSPPPAPPAIKEATNNNGNGGGGGGITPRPLSKTSWYDECGVFKAEHNAIKELEKKAASMTNWYADSGLYQTSGDSVTSSSGSSGVSTGGECNGLMDDNSHSMFCNEPLYQIYSAAKLEVSGKGTRD